MNPMTEQEWGRVQEALVKGGLRECIDILLTSRVALSPRNHQIIQQAYDAGDGVQVLLTNGEDGWFTGQHDGYEVFHALEHKGTLYTIVHLSGGGLVSVIVGSGLIENEMGVAFHGVVDAKVYVQGLTAK